VLSIEGGIMPTKFYTPYGWRGEKYEETKNLPLKEIAKLIRKEIKQKFPDVKVSIRTKHFSGGCSIDVTIKQAPFKIINPEWDYTSPYTVDKYTKEARELLKEIEKIVNQYRYDDSDAQIDYFDTNFYSHVCFDWELEKEELNF